MAKKLELIFRNEDGKTAKISIDNVVEEIEASEVKEAMEDIIDKNVFLSNGGEFVGISGARIVDTNIEVLDLE